MSVSGSSVCSGTDGQSSIIEPNNNFRLKGEDEFGLDDSRALAQGIFGVLYTVSKEKAPGWKLALDFLQLWLILVGPQYGYTGWINTENKLWQVVSLINLNQFLQARGYTFFLGAMYVMAVGLLLAIALCTWVAYSFQNNRFDHVWPIVVLRFYSVAFFQVLDVASLTLFLITLDCQMYFTEQPSRGFHQEFPDLHCWAVPHMVHAAVSIVSLLLFATMAGAFTMAEMELSPLSQNPLAMAHSKVEVLAFVIKFIMTTASTLVLNLKWLSSIQAASALMLLWLYFKWVPHMNAAVNNIRVGLYAAVFYCSIMVLLLGFLPAVDYNDEQEVEHFQEVVTYAMWAGLIPTFALGWLASHFRQDWFQNTVLQSFRDAPPDAKPHSIYKSTDARKVEILGRCCRTCVEPDVLDEEQVRLAERVIKAGMTQLPHSAFMIILYSSFLIDVQTSYQSGFNVLNKAKKNAPSFLERFALFSREQQQAQKNSSSQPGQATDLVSYVEFQRNYRLVLKVHKEALMAVKAFWACLLQRNVKFNSMSTCIDNIETAVRQAERVYRNVLQRHASNVKVVRLYSKFLEHIKYDPWAAANWAAEAEKLEQIEEEHKASNVFEDMDILDPVLRQSLMQMEPINGTTRAIIVINAQSIIQATNQAATDLLGFTRAEMIGRNVSCIIPPPFSEHHNTYVTNYITTGKSVLMQSQNQFVAQHKDKYIVPVSLAISKVSGIGEDSMFMGIIETAANQILENGAEYERLYGHMHIFPYFQYLMANMPETFAEHYYKTMDTMVVWVIEGAHHLNQVQEILLVVEGCVLCSIACFYIWHLSLLVAAQRYSVFQVFLAIPLGLARGLATKKLDLGDDEEDEDDDTPAAAPATTGNTGDNSHQEKPNLAESQKSPGAISVFLRQSGSGPDAAGPVSFWDKLLGILMFWKHQDAQNQAVGSKRKLVQSYKQPLLLMWPFILWGLTIIIMYAIGVTKLNSIDGPIATYNMVNSVRSRTHMFFFELQELVIVEDEEHASAQRHRVMQNYHLLARDWTAMLYGGQALPNETSTHFTLATMGLTYAGGKAADISYLTTACLCEEVEHCKEDPNNPYHHDTHNGLARLMDQLFKNSETIGQMTGLNPAINSPEFMWFWYVRFDLFGGLSELNEYYHGFVMQVYGSVLQIHIAALILTCMIMLGFVMLVLRPFIRKNEYEAKRIAELLSQLPPDLDVESLALRALPKLAAPAVPPDTAAPATV